MVGLVGNQSFLAAGDAAEVFRGQARPELAAFAGRDLTWQDLASLSLLASGLAPDHTGPYLEKLNWTINQARQEIGMLEPKDQAEALLQFLHKGRLGQYRFDQTRLDVLLDTGIYNCVSSALLYFIVGQSLGLSLLAVETTDHSFVTVRIGDRAYDVETTIALGFDPGRRREFHDQFGKLTGFAYVPPGNYARRTLLNGTGLASLVLVNLIALRPLGDAQTIGLAWDLHALTDNENSKNIVYGAYGNYFSRIKLSDQTGGLAIVTRLEDRLGRSSRGDEIIKTLSHNLIVGYLQSGDFDGARTAVATWANRLRQKDSVWYAHIFQAEAQSKAQTSRWQEFRAWLDRAPQLGASPADVPAAGEGALVLEFQKRLGANQPNDWEQALLFYQSLESVWRDQPAVKQIADLLTYNLTVDYHNRLATLVNRGRRDQALVLLREGLSRFPNSRLLLQDQARLNTAK